ncbi:hypothetical protein Mgra_00008709 [Meloidogyne graminicola]|uniref:BLOC-1-related complex subunit 5 n=1 Tax=Meloidogyne graminicola TaxID=189291 RepID=A0A8S9ZF29_9BILA|nr:hypothetical protein Mgra_00008709 [Meloidogyne graminicola]
MGNDQSGVRSRSQGDKELNSPTISMGVPASFSFLTRKLSNINAELDLRRLKEIPHFLPLMQGVLPGYRDLPEVLLKIDPRPIYRFLQRLQQHFKYCTETVTTEQGRIFAHIVEIDQLALSLVKKTTNCNKKLDFLSNELRKVVSLSEQLDTAQVLFNELSRCAESLNQLLPTEEQLAPLSIAFLPILEEKNKVGKSYTNDELGWIKDDEGRSFLAGTVNECRVVDSDCSLNKFLFIIKVICRFHKILLIQKNMPLIAPPPKPGRIRVYRVINDFNNDEPNPLSLTVDDIVYLRETKVDDYEIKCPQKSSLSELYNKKIIQTNLELIEFPLHEAAKMGDCDFLRECLENKVSVNVLDRSSSTALHWAAYTGHSEIIEHLLTISNIAISAQVIK